MSAGRPTKSAPAAERNQCGSKRQHHGGSRLGNTQRDAGRQTWRRVALPNAVVGEIDDAATVQVALRFGLTRLEQVAAQDMEVGEVDVSVAVDVARPDRAMDDLDGVDRRECRW